MKTLIKIVKTDKTIAKYFRTLSGIVTIEFSQVNSEVRS